MASEYIKRCSKSHIIRELQIKARYHYTCLFEWPKSRTLVTAKAEEDVDQQELSPIADENAKYHRHFLIKLNTFLPCDWKLDSLVFTQINGKHTSIQKLKHGCLKMHSRGEGINYRYTPTMDCLSALKINELSSHERYEGISNVYY